jgi:hypothetical protein
MNNHMKYDMRFIISSKASNIYALHFMLWLLDVIMNGNVYCRKFQWITKNTLQAPFYIGHHQFSRRVPLHWVVKCHSLGKGGGGEKKTIPPNYKKVHKSPKTPSRRIEVYLYGRVLFWKIWPCLVKCSYKVKIHSNIHELQIKNSKKILSILTSTKMVFWYLFLHDTFGSKCFVI